jgi:hypothetical protein
MGVAGVLLEDEAKIVKGAETGLTQSDEGFALAIGYAFKLGGRAN